MSFFNNKTIVQKIVIAIVFVILLNFIIPSFSYAGTFAELGSDLLKELVHLIAALGDVAMGALNYFILGTTEFSDSVMLEQGNQSSSINPGEGEEGVDYVTMEPPEELDGLLWSDWRVPNMLVSPENIFADRIAAFDINFLSPNQYTSGQGDSQGAEQGTAIESSSAATIGPVIASWYIGFRNLAIVGLLIVLVYLGIRIVLSSTAADKAQYKERMRDWLIALCLVFFMHFIMSAILMLAGQATNLLGDAADKKINVTVDGDTYGFNLMGYVRFMAQSTDWGEVAGFTILYLALVIYTVMFIFQYFRRLLYVAFLTMISPLVAITYPIDRIGDGKAQAFNKWFKEYLMNVIIQPIHLLLYTALVGSSIELVAHNPIYGLVAIGFLIPAEKFIKGLFGLQAETSGSLGGFAGGALTMQALNALKKPIGPDKGKGSKGGSSDSDDSNDIYIAGKDRFSSWKDDSSESLISEGSNDHSVPIDSQQGGILPVGLDGGNLDGSSQRGESGEESQDSSQYGGGNQQSSEFADESRRQENGDVNGNRSESERDSSSRSENSGRKVPSNWQVAKRLAIRGVRSTGRYIGRNKGKVGRLLTRAAVGAMGAGIGLAAGVTSGDLSKAFSYTVGGAAAGSMIGNNLSNLAGAGYDGLHSAYEDGRNAFIEEKFGYSAAQEDKENRLTEKSRKSFMKNEKERLKAREIGAKLEQKVPGSNFSENEIMQAMFNYRSAGIDEKYVAKGLEIEAKNSHTLNGSNQGKYIDVMKEAQNLSADNIRDDKKLTAYSESLKANLGDKKGEEFLGLTAQALGEDKTLKRKRAQARAKAEAKPNSKPQSKIWTPGNNDDNKGKEIILPK